MSINFFDCLLLDVNGLLRYIHTLTARYSIIIHPETKRAAEQLLYCVLYILHRFFSTGRHLKTLAVPLFYFYLLINLTVSVPILFISLSPLFAPLWFSANFLSCVSKRFDFRLRSAIHTHTIFTFVGSPTTLRADASRRWARARARARRKARNYESTVISFAGDSISLRLEIATYITRESPRPPARPRPSDDGKLACTVNSP